MLYTNCGRPAIRRNAIVGIFLLVAMAVSAIMHSSSAIATLRNLPAEWLPDSVEAKIDFQHFIEQFHVTDLVMVSWPGASLESESLASVTELLRPLSAEAAVQSAGEEAFASSDEWVNEFYENVRQLSGSPTPIDWVRSGRELVDSLVSPPVSRSEANAIARLSGTMIGPDGTQTCMVISLGPSTFNVHRELLPILRSAIARRVELSVEDVALVGGPVDGAAVDQESILSIERFSVPSSIVAAVLCYLCLRSLPLTLAIVAVAWVGEGWVLACVYYSGHAMNAVLIVLPPLVFVLTVSAGIHLSNYYLDIMRESPSPDRGEAAVQAMKNGLRPCLFATGTTMVGLLSLLLVRLEPVRVFGMIASIGVAATLGLLFLILPQAMCLVRPRLRSEAQDRTSPIDNWISAGLRRWRRVIMLFTIVVVIVGWGLGSIDTSVSVPAMFPIDSDLRRQYAWFEENVGATATGDLLLIFPADTTSDALARLELATQVHRAVLDTGVVGGALSAATFVPPISQSSSFAATAARGAIRGQLRDPESSLFRLGYLAKDLESETWRITFRLFQADDANFGSRLSTIEHVAQGVIAASSIKVAPRLAVTGHVTIIEAAQRILLQDLGLSFMTAFGIIAVMMMGMLRSIVGGALSMLPNVVPTVGLFGAMGWLGIPLDIGAIMTASVALGIAIDDTVHLLSRFGAYRQCRYELPAAAQSALRQCGMAMIHTTVVCGFSLLVYALSDFLPTRRFAYLMFAMLAVALVGVLVLLPAMMASPVGHFFSPAGRRFGSGSSNR